MGYSIRLLDGTNVEDGYIGSVTMMSLANNGAFNCEVSPELEALATDDSGIMAIVDANGVDHFLQVAKSGNCNGNWLSKVIKTVEDKCRDGFMVTY